MSHKPCFSLFFQGELDQAGGKLEKIQEGWEYLQVKAALYFNAEMSGLPQHHKVRENELRAALILFLSLLFVV